MIAVIKKWCAGRFSWCDTIGTQEPCRSDHLSRAPAIRLKQKMQKLQQKHQATNAWQHFLVNTEARGSQKMSQMKFV